MKSNEQINLSDLKSRLSKLNAIKNHIFGNSDSQYTENHAVVRAIQREIDDVTSAISQKTNQKA